MKMFRKVLMLGCSAIVLFACSKENSGNTTLRVRMTDAPAPYDEVNVDLREVRVNFSDDSSGWVNLSTHAGIYNLLGLQNGVDTVIAQGTVPTGRVKEIRFVLGDNNTIVVGGQSYPLSIPSGETSGLKIKIDKGLRNNLDSLLIDFDAALSVREENGSYKLRPVLKLK
jgi:hypothetical protein